MDGSTLTCDVMLTLVLHAYEIEPPGNGTGPVLGTWSIRPTSLQLNSRLSFQLTYGPSGLSPFTGRVI